MPIKVNNETDVPSNTVLIEHSLIDGKDEYLCFVEGEDKADNEKKISTDMDEMLVREEKIKKIKKEILSLKITSTKNNEFDCDEVSQQRIARKILVMDDTEKVDWKLADNTIKKVDKAELLEVLKNAMIEQEIILTTT